MEKSVFLKFALFFILRNNHILKNMFYLISWICRQYVAQDCTNNFTRLYKQLYKIVPATLQDCTNNFTSLYQQLYKIVPATLQDCTNNFTSLYKQLYKIVPATLQDCTNNFTSFYQQLYKSLFDFYGPLIFFDYFYLKSIINSP